MSLHISRKLIILDGGVSYWVIEYPQVLEPD